MLSDSHRGCRDHSGSSLSSICAEPGRSLPGVTHGGKLVHATITRFKYKSQLVVYAGDFTFQARFEEQLAPKTCAAFRKAMPFESQAIHVRWSGEGVWMPLGDLDFGVSYENHTSYPAPGQFFTPAASAKRKSCWPMAACISPARWANSRAITSLP